MAPGLEEYLRDDLVDAKHEVLQLRVRDSLQSRHSLKMLLQRQVLQKFAIEVSIQLLVCLFLPPVGIQQEERIPIAQ